MDTWNQAIAGLRREYLIEIPEQLTQLGRLVDDLRREPTARDRLDGLRRGFHSFAGSGETYGYPRVTALGKVGEARCLAAIALGQATTDDFVEWTRLLEAIQAELREAPEDGDASETAPAEEPAAPLDALVVDDDETVTRFLAKRLSLEGFSVRTAGTLAAASVQIDERVPDVLVTDVILPDGTGFEAVERTRLAPGGDQAIILVVSVRAEFLDRVEAIHSGADAYFEKPVDWEALLERLRHLLDVRRVAQARVLSVEDDPHQAAFLRAVLTSGGYEVRTCSDPGAFETEMSAFHPDLVLMDVVLPGASGYDLVRYLRQEEKHATLPVVMVTAETRLEARVSATRAGADDFLLKPVAPGMLLSTVAARIERARFLQGLIERDGLTRLLTHSAFMERARAAAGRAGRRSPRPLVWAMIDVDHFKTVNDRHGHPSGDRVLVALAQLLRRRLRQSDVVGRYGGEEFAVLVEDLEREEAIRLFDRLRADFEALEHRSLGGATFRVTFCAGLAEWNPAGDTLDAWRQRADEALYSAKHAGRNRVVASAPPQAAPSDGGGTRVTSGCD